MQAKIMDKHFRRANASKRPLFEHRHYEAIALCAGQSNNFEQFYSLLIKLFEQDNPRFDGARFRNKVANIFAETHDCESEDAQTS